MWGQVSRWFTVPGLRPALVAPPGPPRELLGKWGAAISGHRSSRLRRGSGSVFALRDGSWVPAKS